MANVVNAVNVVDVGCTYATPDAATFQNTGANKCYLPRSCLCVRVMSVRASHEVHAATRAARGRDRLQVVLRAGLHASSVGLTCFEAFPKLASAVGTDEELVELFDITVSKMCNKQFANTSKVWKSMMEKIKKLVSNNPEAYPLLAARVAEYEADLMV